MLDGFYARCLRKGLRIPVAYVSRVSNHEAFSQAGVKPLRTQLLCRQLILLRKVAHSPEGSPSRRDTFVGDSVRPQIGRHIRNIGRPRLDWTNYLLKEGQIHLGDEKSERMLADRTSGAQQRWIEEWKRTLLTVQ